MINTYQTSLAPPPVPPRLNRSHPVLIPTQLPSQGHSKSLVRFLVGVVLLHLFLSVGGFIYLYSNGKMEKFTTPEGKVSYRSSDKQEAAYKTLARMVVDHESHKPGQKPEVPPAGFLEWDMDRSFRRGINYYHKSWLTIMEPGDYYVYSRVSFSNGNPKLPLASKVKRRKNETGEEKTVMQAFCSLESRSGPESIPHLCTASQGEVITLEKGNQLSVWVQDRTLVNYEEGATTFGMYKL